MDTLDLVRLAELRAKMGAIPVKIILTAGIIYLMRGSLTSFGQYALFSCLFYTIFSLLWWFVRATGNWLIGIVLGIVCTIGGPLFFSSLYQQSHNMLFEFLTIIIFMFGGVILDVWKIFRYFQLCRRLRKDAADGYVFDADEDANGRKTTSAPQEPCEELSFFQGCNNLASLKRRYRDLSRVYHPDNGNGSAEIFAKINNEYEILSQKLS